MITNWNNKVLYTGVTNNVIRRLSEHKLKLVDGFTKKYNLNKVVFVQEFSDVNEAIEAEKKIKGWVRAKKNELVESINPDWNDLAEELIFSASTVGSIKDPSLRSG